MAGTASLKWPELRQVGHEVLLLGVARLLDRREHRTHPAVGEDLDRVIWLLTRLDRAAPVVRPARVQLHPHRLVESERHGSAQSAHLSALSVIISPDKSLLTLYSEPPNTLWSISPLPLGGMQRLLFSGGSKAPATQRPRPLEAGDFCMARPLGEAADANMCLCHRGRLCSTKGRLLCDGSTRRCRRSVR